MRELHLAGFDVRAHSIGGIETCIDLPRQRVAFDIGRCPPEVVAREFVLFTHGHMDHMGGIAYHCSTRALLGMRPPTYIIPPHYRDPLERMFAAWRDLDGSDMTHELVTLEPGDEYELPNRWLVRPFRTYHTVPSQGYALWTRKEKLLPEFKGLPGEEIRRLREEGSRPVTETVETAEVAYCGDTMIDVIEREPVTREAKLLILESTFIDDSISIEETRSRGHTHLHEIAARAALFHNEALLLHHFSARFSAREIRAAAQFPPELHSRVSLLLPSR